MLTFHQLAQILETPLGNYPEYSDVKVVAARKRIQQLYSQRKHDGESFSVASLDARALWLHEAQQYGELPF